MNFSVLNWNIEGSRHYTRTRFGKVHPILGNSSADIFCLQEGQEVKEKWPQPSGWKSFFPVFPKDGSNRNIIISKFPIIACGELSFSQKVKSSFENATWADINRGGKILKIYNCHFGIAGVGPIAREFQLREVIESADAHQGPVIICGDMNTTIPHAGMQRKIVQWFHHIPEESIQYAGKNFLDDERYPFAKLMEQHGFREATDIVQSTWRISPLRCELFKLKLDWFLTRGINIVHASLEPYISDHRAILAECEI